MMSIHGWQRVAATGLFLFALAAPGPAQDRLVRVELAFRAPGSGPSPNFSPKGTQVPLTDLPAAASLPPGAVRPAKAGVIKVGPFERGWIPVLAAAQAEHPKDLCRIYLDRNRNGSFGDDGAPLTATPAAREKTGDWWSSFSATELSVPYGSGPGGDAVEPYQVTFWIVRQGEEAPNLLRYSVRSWRSGAFTIDGTDAFVAAMDNNDAVFDKSDWWSVLEASAPDAAKRVLSSEEARETRRLMFVKAPGKELVLEFRSFTPDGRVVTFAVVDRPVTKSADRAGDDTVAAERSRPRATTPFPWSASFDQAMAEAKRTGRKVVLDFWTSWCGPCRTMDEWIWTDAEVAAVMNAGFAGVKLDGDLQKALVARFAVKGYPTVVILDSSGAVITRFEGYLSSKEALNVLHAGR